MSKQVCELLTQYGYRIYRGRVLFVPSELRQLSKLYRCLFTERMTIAETLACLNRELPTAKPWVSSTVLDLLHVPVEMIARARNASRNTTRRFKRLYRIQALNAAPLCC